MVYLSISIPVVVLQVLCKICVCMLDYEYLRVLAWLMTGVFFFFFGGEFSPLGPNFFGILEFKKK
jgi:hypothetical protein